VCVWCVQGLNFENICSLHKLFPDTRRIYLRAMSSAGLVFQHVGLSGRNSGTLSLTAKGFSWTNRNNTVNQKCDKENILRICWSVFGSKAHIIIYTTDGGLVRFDGFEKSRYGEISQFIKSSLGVDVEIVEVKSCVICSF
jgi:hypothetical protein